jgi:predicted ATPase
MTLQPDGGHLAGVLDRLRDKEPEQFEELNNELARWFPAFNRILFDTPAGGQRAFALRMREGYSIPAADLSDGTLLALAILTLGYVRTQSQIICIEEANRGVHPRLLRDVRDALYRLSYPESSGSSREPVQVIATTHSPYFLDLFRERPEEVVLAHRQGTEAVFERLSDRSDLEEILRDIHLGEAWFSGVLGGVPTDE